MDDQQEQQEAPETTAQEVPVVVEGKPVDKKLDENDPASSALPYHTAATEKIQADRSQETEDAEQPKPEDFEFTANGWTVKAREAKGTEKGFADEDGLVYDVTGNGITPKVYGSKQDAKVFAATTGAAFAERGNIAL
jgi:hypothetical protein